MGLQLPKATFSDAPRKQQPTVPLEQILAVQGQNPIAQVINQITPALTQALQHRQQLRQQGQIIAQMAAANGDQAPDQNTGMTPEQYLGLAKLKEDRVTKGAADAATLRDEKRKNLLAQVELLKLKNGYSTTDASGNRQEIPGAQFDIKTDENGLPSIDLATYKPGLKPIAPPSGGGKGGGNYKNESDLRKEFDKESTESKKSFDASAKALSLASRGDAIGDTSLAFALTKGALGGQGRVTQTEIQQFGPQLGGLPDRIHNAILGLASGQKFDPAVRAQIVDMVKQQAANEDLTQADRETQYKGLAQSYKFNPGNVVHDVRPPTLRPYLKTGLSPLPSPSGGATHKWNPETGKVEVIQ